MIKRRASESGFALVIILGLILVGTLIFALMLKKSTSALHSTGQTSSKTGSNFVADAALQRGILRVQNSMMVPLPSSPYTASQWRSLLTPPADQTYFQESDPTKPNGPMKGETYLSSFGAFEYEEKDESGQLKSNVRYRIVPESTWRFDDYSNIAQRNYKIEVSVVGSKNTKSAFRQDLIVRRESLFKYGIFYDGNLELTLWGDTVFQGPIHSNKNIYLENDQWHNGQFPQSTMKIYGPITAAGHIMRSNLNYANPPLTSEYSQIKVFWSLTDTWGVKDPTKFTNFTYAANSPLPPEQRGVDAILPRPGFKPIDLNDPAKEGVTWDVDPLWIDPNETLYKFNEQVQDVSHGVKKVESPDATVIADKIKTNAHLRIETGPGNTSDDILLKVFKKDGTLMFEKHFSKGDIGEADWAVSPPPDEIYPEPNLNPVHSLLHHAKSDPVAQDVTITIDGTPIRTRRGPPPNDGGNSSNTCVGAFYQERVWSSSEDMFVYNTVIDVTKLQHRCLNSNSDDTNIVYASRSDAEPDHTIYVGSHSNPDDDFNIDGDRKPYGYTLTNGDGTGSESSPIPDIQLEKPFIFATDVPVIIRGNFNRHTGPKPPDDPAYVRNADHWQPAAIIADRIFTESNIYDVTQNNLFRRASGRYEEFLKNLKDSANTRAYARCPYSQHCNVPLASDMEINAIFLAGQVPTQKDYTDWINAGHYISQSFQDGGMKDSEPKQTSGFARFIMQEEDFSTTVQSIPAFQNPRKITFWGSFLNLFKPKYATHYNNQCPVQFYSLFGPGRYRVTDQFYRTSNNPYPSDFPNASITTVSSPSNDWGLCGEWKKGGSGGGRMPDRMGGPKEYKYEPNLARGRFLPDVFRDLFPAELASTRKPYEKSNFQILDPDPLHP